MTEKLDVAFVRGTGKDLTLSVLGQLPVPRRRHRVGTAERFATTARAARAARPIRDPTHDRGHAVAGLERTARVGESAFGARRACAAKPATRSTSPTSTSTSRRASRRHPRVEGASLIACSNRTRRISRPRPRPPRWRRCRPTCSPTGTRTGSSSRPRSGVSCGCTRSRPWPPTSPPKGRWAEAIAAAQAAIRGEPLRETSHAALIRVFLAEGNQTEALGQFKRYRTLLNDELSLDPTSQDLRPRDPARAPSERPRPERRARPPQRERTSGDGRAPGRPGWPARLTVIDRRGPVPTRDGSRTGSDSPATRRCRASVPISSIFTPAMRWEMIQRVRSRHALASRTRRRRPLRSRQTRDRPRRSLPAAGRARRRR